MTIIIIIIITFFFFFYRGNSVVVGPTFDHLLLLHDIHPLLPRGDAVHCQKYRTGASLHAGDFSGGIPKCSREHLCWNGTSE